MFKDYTKEDVFAKILNKEKYLKSNYINPRPIGVGFAPSNIALSKYWGKRDIELNLPLTSSLSISLNDKGATTSISILNDKKEAADIITLNGKKVDKKSDFYIRLTTYLDYIRKYTKHYYLIDTEVNIPVAAGLASSACGFAALVNAIDKLYNLNLEYSQKSILARIGSGSASRSFWDGFVVWHKGKRKDGMDSYAEKIDIKWPEFRIGLLVVDSAKKSIGSKEAMIRTANTSKLYEKWPEICKADIEKIHFAIINKNFSLLGKASESNALAMHALMLNSWPPIMYSTTKTLELMNKVWKLRNESEIELYFTQDAGPNIKLLFLKQDEELIRHEFKDVEVISPFASTRIINENVLPIEASV